MGFHVGEAPLGARPDTVAMESPGRAKTAASERTGGSRPATAGLRGPSRLQLGVEDSLGDAGAREEAYFRFKREDPEGASLHQEVK